LRFYSESFLEEGKKHLIKKLNFLNKKTKITTRYSCIPDYTGIDFELYTDGNYMQPVEKRMEIYKEKIMPLATKAIDQLLIKTKIETGAITHLITVSCTGLFAPGLEFLVAEKYGLQNAEKSALNFLGCYAAMKALKQAHYVAQANPHACILIVSAELCSLHFYPTEIAEDMIANLLFADGAAAAIVCGDKSSSIQNKVVLQIDQMGTAFLPQTASLMTWNLSSTAFRMHLSPEVVNAIKRSIHAIVNDFLGTKMQKIDYWAIHPGGVRIVEAVQESLNLTENNVSDSMKVMQNYGNMSSPTILFILSSIFDKIREQPRPEQDHMEQDHMELNPPDKAPIKTKKIFACAFGPGLNIEMLRFSTHLSPHAV